MSVKSRTTVWRAPEAPVRSRPRGRFVSWLSAAVAVHRARRELKRLLSPPRSRGDPPLSAHLRRDLGLTPYESGRHFWDHE